MESNHDEVPVSITQVPSNPCRGVSVQHQRQQDQIGYSDNGAGQYDHKTDKHLPKHRLRMLVRISIRSKRTNKQVNKPKQIHTLPNLRVTNSTVQNAGSKTESKTTSESVRELK